MKKIISLLLLLPCVVQAYTGNDLVFSSTVAAGATAGIIAGTQRVFYDALMNMELKGWKEKNTGTTTVLESQCSLNTEFHLVGDHGKNYLVLGITNPTDTSVVLKQSEIEFRFNESGTRYPGWTVPQSDFELSSGWWLLVAIPFPSKEEFAKYQTLEARIPIHSKTNKNPCTVSAKFSKKESISSEQVSYTIFDYHFEGGFPFTPSGPMEKLGKASSIFGIGFNIYFNPNHGAGFSLLSESGFDSGNNSKVYQKFEKGSQYDALITSLSLNYVYRKFLANNLSINYEPGIGYQSITDQDAEIKNRDISSALMFSQKFILNWRFATSSHHPQLVFGFNAGIGPIHIYVPKDSIGGANVDGHRFGILLRLGMGF